MLLWLRKAVRLLWTSTQISLESSGKWHCQTVRFTKIVAIHLLSQERTRSASSMDSFNSEEEIAVLEKRLGVKLPSIMALISHMQDQKRLYNALQLFVVATFQSHIAGMHSWVFEHKVNNMGNPNL